MNLYNELQEKLSEHIPTEVDELILDDLFEDVAAFTEQNKKDLERYSSLLHLSLNGFGLESLKNFPKLPTLRVLEIRQNNLKGDDFAKLYELYPELYKLKVGDNPIKSLDVFKALSSSNIKKIEAMDTGASEQKDFSTNMFNLIPTLEVLNGKNRENDDVSTTMYDEEGEDMDEDDVDGDGEEFEGEDDEEFEEYEDENDAEDDDE